MPRCLDCKHIRFQRYGTPVCRHPKLCKIRTWPDHVFGHDTETVSYESCRVLRRNAKQEFGNPENFCEPEAKYFEPGKYSKLERIIRLMYANGFYKLPSFLLTLLRKPDARA